MPSTLEQLSVRKLAALRVVGSLAAEAPIGVQPCAATAHEALPLYVAASTDPHHETLRSLAEASDVNKGDYDKRTVRRSAAQTLDWGSDSSARHV